MIVFLDIETTGLDPVSDRILEVAAVEVSASMEPVRGWSAVIHHPRALTMDPYVRDMHTRSGLLTVIPGGTPERAARADLLAWLDLCVVPEGRAPGAGALTLAGDSVHFDRSFLIAQWPEVAARFSHRLLDTSAFRVARDIAGLPACPVVGGGHRAESDVLASIAKARWHMSRITP